ncbi:hypothetical protein EIP86_003098 [Pleurotus ostreatoroseus]|nr:hypothetical protein EIP86_003098 [Pleurotus ostreatoroseus]
MSVSPPIDDVVTKMCSEMRDSNTETEDQQRDAWMSYTVRKVLVSKLESSAITPERLAIGTIRMTRTADGSDNTVTDYIKWLKPSVAAVNKFNTSNLEGIEEYLSSFEGKKLSAKQVLELCDSDLESGLYDLVLSADRAMVPNDVCDDLRVADIISTSMAETIDTLEKTQHGVNGPLQQLQKKLRISLRRVWLRFFKDANYLPRWLFIPNFTVPLSDMPATGGPIADVYSAMHEGRMVAVKSFRIFRGRKLQSNSHDIAQRAIFDIIIWSKLNHAHLLPFLGLHKQIHHDVLMFYVISPWMINGSMKDYMSHTAESPGLPVLRIRWLQQIASGLRYLHDECIVHGDLHGGNILLDEQLNVCIADFALLDLTKLTNLADVPLENTQGSDWWTAPECIEDDEAPVYQSDVWAFGCACLLIWTGRGPFAECHKPFQVYRTLMIDGRSPEGSPHMDTIHHQDIADADAGTFLREQIALRCWQRKPETRPTMEELESDLKARFDSLAEP